MISYLTSEAGRLYRFGLVGVAATAVHLAMAWLVMTILTDASEFLANGMAFAAAFPVSLFGHRHFTFRKRGSAKRFLVVALSGFAANNGLLGAILVFTKVDGVAAIAAATFLVPLLTYVASRLWAFRTSR